jgi:hypothetical protein
MNINACFARFTRIVLTLLCVSWSAWSGEVALRNAGFESILPNGMPASWSAAGERRGTAAVVRSDSAEHRTGKASVRVSLEGWDTYTLVSDPVQLVVGHLYRLSGWIRTDRVHADPLSRYPTAVAATLSMESFPFTNHTPAVGGTHGWRKVESCFFATQVTDCVRLHLGYNGTAQGTAWFDDVLLEEIDDITAIIPAESVQWYGPAFSYTDRGWTFVHIEGKPYDRGVQFGTLTAKGMSAYMEKLAYRANPDNPKQGWADTRKLADALFFRKYGEEYLTEMKGIADGAAKAGGTIAGRTVDLLDVVTLNSVVDLGQLGDALAKTANPLSGRSFKAEEAESETPERLHKCSSFLANGPASKDGDVVFGQLFMWSGYTGVHWNVICDVVPSEGHRLVYETFPGGIHSGADFYINDAGIMIGETTVMQTPFAVEGLPQSMRIRKAAQYAESIDDVVRILSTGNNGLYTNDWLIADAKTNETAILLLGTERHKLWRSGKGDFPGGTTGFYWSVNNAKDPDVRKEYVPDPTNAPFDVVYGNVNRDIAFTDYYARKKGSIDGPDAMRLLATSPINRPHACDGKVTTSTMARHLMFQAHFGKVTLREKMPEKGSRLMPDFPGVQPHLSLGYSTINPVFVTEKLKQLKARPADRRSADNRAASPVKGGSAKDVHQFAKQLLWANTVYPASDADNWFTSGSAAYWGILNGMPTDPNAAATYLRDQLAELNCRLQFTMSREGTLAPANARRRYDGTKDYIIPRIRGTFLLHQLRLMLGNELFSSMMTAVHERYHGKTMTTAQFMGAAEAATGRKLSTPIRQWLERVDLPAVRANAHTVKSADGWNLLLTVQQSGDPYALSTTVTVELPGETRWYTLDLGGPGGKVPTEPIPTDTVVAIPLQEKPLRVVFNAGNDIPVFRTNFYTFSNYFDEFRNSAIVFGTGREDEAQHTMALRFQTVLADQFTEVFAPLWRDGEVDDRDISSHDLILLGSATDNSLLAKVADTLGVRLGHNTFMWRGTTYAEPDDGLFAAFPNPADGRHVLYLFVANSALELYQMTKRYQPLAGWGIFKGESVVERGFHAVDTFVLPVAGGEPAEKQAIPEAEKLPPGAGNNNPR